MTVREALSEWMGILSKIPKGTEIETREEGASPGAGAEMVASLLLFPDSSAAALVIKAGVYDGHPRVFASVFRGQESAVTKAVQEWKESVET